MEAHISTQSGLKDLEDVRFFEDLGAKKIFTLGGLGTGELVKDNRVFVAANNQESLDEVIQLNSTSIRKDEGGAIIGASGLLLYYAEEKEILKGIDLKINMEKR